ncbi:accessory Sec system S-layer assembly protein [Halobacillus litoralis]|uniref:accessory Sec system S-layer assembly protein n=1 Tax=Halobacillus litoralis TaxID=45668 RepID=UPI001CFD3395|nr:accessory Sec system S-layer assembly protein [Halobacillus litoralis]WLR49031.1 accessory Sec system S-layer assembly protein [Halobacillus litoralis]
MFKWKKKEKETKAYDEGAVDASLLTGKEEEVQDTEEVYTELSLHPDWHLPEEETYVYRFYNSGLPPLKPNQVSVTGFDIQKKDQNILVKAFLRNSLQRGIHFNPTSILLLDKQGQLMARKQFDLTDVGFLPGRSSRPWIFSFHQKDFINNDTNIPVNGWKLAFETQTRKHSLDLEETWEKSLDTEEIDKLEEYVSTITPPKPGEVNFLGLQVTFSDEGNLHVTLLVRNGNEEDITLKSIPLVVEDATGKVIAKGGFKLNDLKVKANTSKPWTFVFPKNKVNRDEVDLSRWKVYPK